MTNLVKKVLVFPSSIALFLMATPVFAEEITLSEAQVGILVEAFLIECVNQITINLPTIMAFIAGMIFLRMGIRWTANALRGSEVRAEVDEKNDRWLHGN